MIPDVSQALARLEKHPQALQGIQRGLERETLRVNADGTLATTGHPPALGSALTHKWITTDFAEALLEFITPVDGDIEHMLTFMRDVHRYTARQIGDERMWPLSMPCYIAPGQDIELAQYGTSNVGRLKTLYREGLKNRYGALMQTISGVHYNFSLPMAFWQAKCGVEDAESGKEAISAGYFRSIRNYYRFGWVIPICSAPRRRFALRSCKESRRRCPLRRRATACITCRTPPRCASATLVIPISRKAISELRLTICTSMWQD